jgi:phenylacetate-CoA ligase
MNALCNNQLHIDAGREEALRACFERARGHRLFRDFYGGVDNLADAPAMDKLDLQRALRGFRLDQESIGVYLVRSGGSTSEPLIVPVDIVENHRQRAALALQLTQMGLFDSRTVALNTFGYADLYRSAAIMDDLLERCFATTLPMSAHALDADLHAAALRFRPTHLLGTPSRLLLFARHLRDADQRIDIPNLLFAGEFLRASALQQMRQSFGTRRLWSLYGAAETGIWGCCDADAQPGLFSILPGVVVEILAPDSDGFGAIAVSNSWRRRFPVFRYRLGDIGRLVRVNGADCLELRARDARSFQFCELKHDLDALEPLTAGAECFQVQLSCSAEGHDRMRLLLQPRDDVPLSADELALRTRRLRELLQCSERVAEISVEHAHDQALHTDPATTKTPAIVDFRR